MALDINDLDIFLGKKLRNFRIKMNWPLKTLSMKLGISIQQLHRYETGVNKISASLLYSISQEFKSSVSDFYEDYQEVEEKSSSTNILLIEQNNGDELLFRQALMEFPEKLNILSCHNGEEALNFFRNVEDKHSSKFSRPNLIFLDLKLPLINGFDVLKNIKCRQSLQNIPVIVFTRDYSREDILRSYCLHANGFINISLSYKEIRQQLHKSLSYWIHTVELPV